MWRTAMFGATATVRQAAALQDEGAAYRNERATLQLIVRAGGDIGHHLLHFGVDVAVGD
jgi:hypothetical protein